MPIEQEKKLKEIAAQKGMTGEKADAFVYGTMRHQGWKPQREKDAAQERAAKRRRKKK